MGTPWGKEEYCTGRVGGDTRKEGAPCELGRHSRGVGSVTGKGVERRVGGRGGRVGCPSRNDAVKQR